MATLVDDRTHAHIDLYRFSQARRHWRRFGDTELISQRSLAAQVLIGGAESEGISLMVKYTRLLGSMVGEMLFNLGALGNDNETLSNSTHPSNAKRPASPNSSCLERSSSRGIVNDTTDISESIRSCLGGTPAPSPNITVVRSPSTEDTEEILLGLLLGEAQGTIRPNSKLSDLPLSVSEIRSLDSKQRFRLGVGLAKLGLFDLSLRHVSMSAAPWEAPLYRWRAKLVFSPVHYSVRSLAQSVGNFAKQCEGAILHKEPASPMMVPICNSLNELALALQALPLLHLAGFASARETAPLGHSPVGLPVLLGEVFNSMCPPRPPPASISPTNSAHKRTNGRAESKGAGKGAGVHAKDGKEEVEKTVIGIVAGSFDGVIGRIVVGE